ncbi:hypothetical protein WEN_01420 [Mycoplasma wenyonii str. Massachusetts]|uniref:Uncharacterized protein n=1 Tax=Mycoplasma wenyonii (strain Massachusetts) TaxID=1197325 RepID=I6YLB5_MYCWM|nr:hypothetical protein [Mycoplasma wenyonii]AFN65079.1 hypothetical protein WEN_01420 [Mycoplasma wenyonii str. Massachusetts]
MLLGLKSALAIGIVTLVGIVSPHAYFAFRVRCYPMSSDVLLREKLSVAEPILKCADWERDYSVFLAIKNGSDSRNQNVPFLKVVDNKTKETKWEGSNNSGTNHWQDWAIEIFQDNNDHKKEKTSIRVLKSGNKWQKWHTVSVLCQTTQLQLKKSREGIAGCAGHYLLGTKMKLSVSGGNISLSQSSKFDWKEEFKKSPVFCNA